MEVLTDLAQYSTLFAVIGAVLFVVGMLIRGGNTQKKVGSSVVAMLFITIGIILLLFAAANWVTDGFTAWNTYSERML